MDLKNQGSDVRKNKASIWQTRVWPRNQIAHMDGTFMRAHQARDDVLMSCKLQFQLNEKTVCTKKTQPSQVTFEPGDLIENFCLLQNDKLRNLDFAQRFLKL